MIVLDALFIGDIDRCFFASSICEDLGYPNNRTPTAPLGRKVQVLKAQMALAALLLATALLYILLFILASLGSRNRSNRVVIEDPQAPPHVIRNYGAQSSPQQPVVITGTAPTTTQPAWKSTSVPVTYEPSQLECPHCGTMIKLAQKKR